MVVYSFSYDPYVIFKNGYWSIEKIYWQHKGLTIHYRTSLVWRHT